MDIVKINGASYMQGASAKKDFSALLDKKILLEDDIPVFQFVDNAGLDGNSIHNIRVAREIVFGFTTCLKHKPTGKVLLKPGSFSELIRYLDEKELLNYRFVLETEDKDVLSRTIQYLLYLDINIEVMLKKEESEIRKMELLLKMSGDLKRALVDAKGRIHNRGKHDAIREYRSTILYTLAEIETNLGEMQGKDLKVAIMALKKSGKSVVVNCLLGGDYAPASVELPTFTTCVYRKREGKKISLAYKDNTLSFDSPEALKKYILNEFKSIHIDKTEYAPDDCMYVSYIPNKDSLCNYTIIDTPGPDLAGDYYKNIAYRWIGEADIILFIIDYSKHLTNSEEEFFRAIKRVFEEHQKFYSFIVIVNKLDLMYLSEEKKSGLRFIDFLRSKLKDLGYKGFTVFGISALQYIYSLTAPQIAGCGDLNTNDGKKLREYLDKCLQLYQGKDEMTSLSFLDNQIRNLLRFHGKEDATLQDLKEKSGVEHLMKYINYIAMEKAHIELFNHKLSLIDRKLAEFRTNFIGDLLDRLEEDSRTLERTISDITHFREEMLTDAKQDFKPEEILNSIEKDVNLARKSLYKVLTMHMENIEKHLVKIIKSLSNAELVSFQKGNSLKAIGDMFYKIEKGIIEKLYAPVLGKHCGSLNKELAARNKRFGEFKETIQEKISDLDMHFKKNYRLNCSDVVLPGVPDSFTRFDFAPIVMRLDDLFAQSLIKERLIRKRGLLGSLLMVTSLGFINVKTGKFKFDDIKLKKALLLERKSLDGNTQQQVDEMHRKLLSHISVHLNRLENSLLETYGAFENDCTTVFNNFTDDLKILKKEIESKIEFLKEAEKGLERFTALWDKIRTPDQ